MDEVAGLRRPGMLSPRPPADFADARQDVGDRLLLAMMVNSGTGARFDLEQSAPQRRLDAGLRRNRGQAHGAGRLCGSLIEFGWTDNANGGIGGDHVLDGSLPMIRCADGLSSRRAPQLARLCRSPDPMPGKPDLLSSGSIQVINGCCCACPKLRTLAFACTFGTAKSHAFEQPSPVNHAAASSSMSSRPLQR